MYYVSYYTNVRVTLDNDGHYENGCRPLIISFYIPETEGSFH